MIVVTPHGGFQIRRKNTVAITVVRTKRPVCHYQVLRGQGAVTHIEHRKRPESELRRNLSCCSWATPIATYEMNGKPFVWGEVMQTYNLHHHESLAMPDLKYLIRPVVSKCPFDDGDKVALKYGSGEVWVRAIASVDCLRVEKVSGPTIIGNNWCTNCVSSQMAKDLFREQWKERYDFKPESWCWVFELETP